MNKEFIPYEQSLALKELGFDETCFGYYDNKGKIYYNTNGQTVEKDWVWIGNQILPTDMILAPLYQQAFRWFREKYSLRGFIGWRPNVKKWDFHAYDLTLSGKEYVKSRGFKQYNEDPTFDTYEQAEDACINKIIEIIKIK